MDRTSHGVGTASLPAIQARILAWSYLGFGLLAVVFVVGAYIYVPDAFMRGLLPGSFAYALLAVSVLYALAARDSRVLPHAIAGMWLSAGSLALTVSLRILGGGVDIVGVFTQLTIALLPALVITLIKARSGIRVEGRATLR
jgi:hypothetical protein